MLGYDGDNEETRVAELVEFFKDNNIDNALFETFNDIQREFRIRQTELVNQLDAKEITPEEYLDTFNEQSSTMFKALNVLLGGKKYNEVFDNIPPGAEIIDRATFLGLYDEDGNNIEDQVVHPGVNDELAKKYDQTMKVLNKFVVRQADGTFTLIMSKDEPDIEAGIFYEFIRSLAHTNYLINEGLLDPKFIED